MIPWKKENRNGDWSVLPHCLISCSGHRRHHNRERRKLRFDSLQKGEGTEYFPNRGGVNPDRSLGGQVRVPSQPLREFFAVPRIKEASYQKVGNGEEEVQGEGNIIELMDHCPGTVSLLFPPGEEDVEGSK